MNSLRSITDIFLQTDDILCVFCKINVWFIMSAWIMLTPASAILQQDLVFNYKMVWCSIETICKMALLTMFVGFFQAHTFNSEHWYKQISKCIWTKCKQLPQQQMILFVSLWYAYIRYNFHYFWANAIRGLKTAKQKSMYWLMTPWFEGWNNLLSDLDCTIFSWR